MPVMDGWQMLRHLKAGAETQQISVIALSAHAIVGDKERALEVGLDGYMTKPVNVPTLIDDMKAAFEKRPQSEQV
jgi:CheY-like chemotaxis protein